MVDSDVFLTFSSQREQEWTDTSVKRHEPGLKQTTMRHPPTAHCIRLLKGHFADIRGDPILGKCSGYWLKHQLPSKAKCSAMSVVVDCGFV